MQGRSISKTMKGFNWANFFTMQRSLFFIMQGSLCFFTGWQGFVFSAFPLRQSLQGVTVLGIGHVNSPQLGRQTLHAGLVLQGAAAIMQGGASF